MKCCMPYISASGAGRTAVQGAEPRLVVWEALVRRWWSQRLQTDSSKISWLHVQTDKPRAWAPRLSSTGLRGKSAVHTDEKWQRTGETTVCLPRVRQSASSRPRFERSTFQHSDRNQEERENSFSVHRWVFEVRRNKV